ncbi:type II toxin-antitoxin system RelE/ParE family toxin [Tistlia consotensis]|uniref:type II toxin-antitoxin system RelE/ParE family toxin n=1 Tax=Tistlia consotensis TaxID=1321365 RepID=UPI000A16A09A|nr:type II toxin-antitoxin system RelE/ParE family toxin [Tistlia consotensis]
MTRSIVRTRQCDEDLLAIWLHIARDDIAAADRMIERIERRWRQLAEQPLSGTPRDDVAAGLRHLVVGSYLVLYRASGNVVQVVRVLHGRRDLAGEGAVDDEG